MSAWFKNIIAYRFTPRFTDVAALTEQLGLYALKPSGSLERVSNGWTPPIDHGDLAYAQGDQVLINFCSESKLLPASVVTTITKARAEEIEEAQGFKPGRKQMREIKEEVTDKLLPQAFAIRRNTRVWLDMKNGYMMIDTATAARCDAILSLLNKCIDNFPLANVHVAISPVAAMTEWLARDEAPEGFSIDQDTALESKGEGRAKIRYTRQSVDADDVRKHIEDGKVVSHLAMTWADRISFALDQTMTIKRIAPLEVIKEGAETTPANEEERFAADFVLMTGELGRLLQSVINAMGGERVDEVQGDLVDDEAYRVAVATIREHHKASISLIQQATRTGYNKAARHLERMEKDGIVSPMRSDGRREILIPF